MAEANVVFQMFKSLSDKEKDTYGQFRSNCYKLLERTRFRSVPVEARASAGRSPSLQPIATGTFA